MSLSGSISVTLYTIREKAPAEEAQVLVVDRSLTHAAICKYREGRFHVIDNVELPPGQPWFYDNNLIGYWSNLVSVQ